MLGPKSMLLAATSALIGISTAADCNSGPFFQTGTIGGNGGNDFCESKWDEGKIITRIDVTVEGNKWIRGLQFGYNDGSVGTILGRMDGNKKVLEWKASQRITKLSLWGNGRGERLGKILIRFADGQEIEHGKDVSGQREWERDVGAGIMLGAYGKAADDIDNLGLLMLGGQIQKVEVTDVVLDEDLAGTNNGITPESITELVYRNALANVTLEGSYHKTTETTRSSSWSQSVSETFGVGVEVEVSGQVMGIGASVNSNFNWEKSTDSEYTNEESRTEVEGFDFNFTVPPKTAQKCTAKVGKGTYNQGYNSNVKVKLVGGGEFTFTERGRAQATKHSKIEYGCEPIPLQEIKASDTIQDVKPTDKEVKVIPGEKRKPDVKRVMSFRA